MDLSKKSRFICTSSLDMVSATVTVQTQSTQAFCVGEDPLIVELLDIVSAGDCTGSTDEAELDLSITVPLLKCLSLEGSLAILEMPPGGSLDAMIVCTRRFSPCQRETQAAGWLASSHAT